MKVKLKEGDTYVEVDTELSNEIIDTYEKEISTKKEENLENTIEIKLNMENNNESTGNR